MDHGPDAHLIAAAPDLYAALEEALPFVEGYQTSRRIHEGVAAAIRAVLAKARGEA